MSGRKISHYEILDELGAGGMGIVYRARDARLDRDVAIKVLRPDVGDDPTYLARFRQEARAAAALNHPCIAAVFDIGSHDGSHFIVQEYVEGVTLRSLVREGTPAVERVVRMALEVSEALTAAHDQGIVHRDVKPENIMLRHDGHVKLLDFGLARLVPTGDLDTAATVTETLGATTPGTMLGTLRYMSPEQARAETVDAASDLFSFGVVLYEMVTGQHPFHSGSNVGTINAILTQTPLAPSRLRPELPADLEALILQMLRKDRRLRPGAAEVRGTLQPLVAEVRAPRTTAVRHDRHTVGRKSERAELVSAFEAAASGGGSLLCISGEPGIGKTTLVEDVLAELETEAGGPTIGRGRCSERLAGTEAYLPLLEALESLLGGDSSGWVARLMRLVAPTWFVQVAPLAADDASDARLTAEIKDASQERMKRELDSFVQEVSRLRPLVLFLDDLHWADVSTVDMLAYLGSRLGSTSMLLIATYRGEEMTGHPFVKLRLDLQGRGLCRELQLGFLVEEAVARYLALEFPNHRFPGELSRIIHARSEGSPLFMADLVRSLRSRDIIIERHGGWNLAQPVTDIVDELPESIRSVIERKIGQLADADRRLLVAASVQGDEFDAAVVAQALGSDAADVEERLQGLERTSSLVRPVREKELPDGTLTLRCRFVHVLYQNALYATLTPARRASLSRGVAEALVGFHGDNGDEVAAELAYLFEQARDFAQATQQFQGAATKAVQIFAYHEAIALAGRGLALIEKLPDPEERVRSELALQMTLGNSLVFIRGPGHAHVEQAYVRARELCRQVGDDALLFTVLQGLYVCYIQRNDLKTAHDLAMQSLELARRGDSPEQVEVAQMILGVGYFWRGLFPEAQNAFAEALALSPPGVVSRGFLGIDPKWACLSDLALTLWVIGKPDQASRCLEEARAVADAAGEPFARCAQSLWEAWSHQMRRKHREALEEAKTCLDIAQEHGFSDWIAVSRSLSGCSLVEQGLDAGNGDDVNEGRNPGARAAVVSRHRRPDVSRLLPDRARRALRQERCLRRSSGRTGEGVRRGSGER